MNSSRFSIASGFVSGVNLYIILSEGEPSGCTNFWAVAQNEFLGPPQPHRSAFDQPQRVFTIDGRFHRCHLLVALRREFAGRCDRDVCILLARGCKKGRAQTANTCVRIRGAVRGACGTSNRHGPVSKCSESSQFGSKTRRKYPAAAPPASVAPPRQTLPKVLPAWPSVVNSLDVPVAKQTSRL